MPRCADLRKELMTITNYFNRVTLGNYGSDFHMIMAFAIVMCVAALLAVIASFFRQKKA